jgi:hypothetical protein
VLGGKDGHLKGAVSVVARRSRTVSHDVYRAPRDGGARQREALKRDPDWQDDEEVQRILGLDRLLPLADAQTASRGGRGRGCESRDSGRKPRYSLSAGQTRALWLLDQTVLAAQRDNVDNVDDSSDDSDKSNESSSNYKAGRAKNDNESELNKTKVEELERYVLTLLIALLDY